MTSFKLTISEIKDIKGLKNITDDQAEFVSEFLALYSTIIYDKMRKNYENRYTG
ncbi:MAG: hypothetical protein J6Q73_07835 [Bacteroidaceae bacterium]|nr:hypothetical protein [Bacteroidaceae bacterium]